MASARTHARGERSFRSLAHTLRVRSPHFELASTVPSGIRRYLVRPSVAIHSRGNSAPVLAVFPLLSLLVRRASPTPSGASGSDIVTECSPCYKWAAISPAAASLSLPCSLSLPTRSHFAGGGSDMPCGGGRVSNGGGGGDCKKPPPPGVHPRYVPERGAVLKGILRGVLRGFVLVCPPLISGTASSGGRRVRPAPPGAGAGGGAEQGK
ncbi:hypothetical protein ACP4OV_000971 [Aristida adscensionis]